MLLMQVQISLLESGLYHLANMSLFHFHLLHLLQVLYLVELADGGLEWLIATGGLELADCDLRIALQSAFFAWWGAGAWRNGP